MLRMFFERFRELELYVDIVFSVTCCNKNFGQFNSILNSTDEDSVFLIVNFNNVSESGQELNYFFKTRNISCINHQLALDRNRLLICVILRNLVEWNQIEWNIVSIILPVCDDDDEYAHEPCTTCGLFESKFTYSSVCFNDARMHARSFVALYTEL
jgi:hypothetical protein